MRLFRFNWRRKKRSIFIQTDVEVPLKMIIAIGKRHIVGIAEFGDETATVERPVLPFFRTPEPEEIARELLRKLGIPENEWEEILKTKTEIQI